MPAPRASAKQSAVAPPSARGPNQSVVSLLFFVSGAAGLIFQVVWFHRCGLVFGNSLWATSIVLSSFMAGLALGGALVAWLGRRITRPLHAYAVLEAVVAVSGVGLTYALPALTSVVPPITSAFVDSPWVVNLIRLVTAFAVLLVPSTAMGATLPLLAGSLSRRRMSTPQGPGPRGPKPDGDFGRLLGRLYGWNTVGAVIGVLTAEIFLIGRVGVAGSAWSAGALDIAVSGVALWIARRAGDSASPVVPAAAATWSSRASVLLGCAFLTGACLTALEVVWFRFLSMFVATSTLAVSVMLAVVLSGIALGGLVASRWLRRQRQASVSLPALVLAAAAVVVATYATFQSLTEGAQIGTWTRILWYASVLTLPNSLLSGVIFTLAGDALQREVGEDTRAAGWLTTANTAGALLGPLVGGFVLLPRIGMERSFFGIAALYAVAGILATRGIANRSRATSSWAFRTAAVAMAGALLLFPFGLMAAAYFPRALQPHRADGSETVATLEGPSETIFLMQKIWMGEPIYHRLVTNGFSMSGTLGPAKRYMRYFAYWPMLVHQRPLRRALVICYGVGVTAGAVRDIDSLESIDVVEISRDVIAVSDRMYAPGDHPLRDPRVRLHLEDGRYFLETTDERYDLITGEPPPFLTPGTVNLYTREYFRLIRDRLADGGIATYWLPIAPRDGSNPAAVVKAFCDVFEDCSLWNGTPYDLMLAGTRRASGPVSESQFMQPWTDPVLGTRLREIGFEMPEQVGATFIGDGDYLRRLTATTLPLTDDYPKRLLLPLSSPLSGIRDRPDRGPDFLGTVIDPARTRQAFASSELIRRFWPESLLRDTLPFFEAQRVINRVLVEGANPLRQVEDLHFLLTRTRLERLPIWLLGLGSHPIQARVNSMPDDGSGQVEYVRGLLALSTRDYPGAASYLARAEQRGLAGVRALLVYSLCLAGQLEAAQRLAADVRPTHPDAVHFWQWLQTQFGVSALLGERGGPN